MAGGFGVRGEVRITTYTETPLALARYRELKREDGAPGLTILQARAAKDGVIARTAEVATKEAADALRGLGLYVPRAALPPVSDEDEFYLADLVGLQARDPAGAPVGTVKAVQNFGAGDILELDPGDGRPTLYVPFTRDAVPEVRVAEGWIAVVPPPAENESEKPGPVQSESRTALRENGHPPIRSSRRRPGPRS